MPEVEVKFDRDGLVPCIAQNAETGEVLTLAYMNEESLRLTRESGLVTYFSRSRQKIWQKVMIVNLPGGPPGGAPV